MRPVPLAPVDVLFALVVPRGLPRPRLPRFTTVGSLGLTSSAGSCMAWLLTTLAILPLVPLLLLNFDSGIFLVVVILVVISAI